MSRSGSQPAETFWESKIIISIFYAISAETELLADDSFFRIPGVFFALLRPQCTTNKVARSANLLYLTYLNHL